MMHDQVFAYNDKNNGYDATDPHQNTPYPRAAASLWGDPYLTHGCKVRQALLTDRAQSLCLACRDLRYLSLAERRIECCRRVARLWRPCGEFLLRKDQP